MYVNPQTHCTPFVSQLQAADAAVLQEKDRAHALARKLKEEIKRKSEAVKETQNTLDKVRSDEMACVVKCCMEIAYKMGFLAV